MERLTAFEFIAADAQIPTQVRLKRGDEVIATFWFVGYIAVPFVAAPTFETREDLVLEGQGLGRPYWNGERTPWDVGFDPSTTLQRIAQIRQAAMREVNRAALVLM